MDVFRGDMNYGPMTQDNLAQDMEECTDLDKTDGVPDAERGNQVGGRRGGMQDSDLDAKRGRSIRMGFRS
jgi:hypothetical protein